jgi:glycosyl hydrolase family 53
MGLLHTYHFFKEEINGNDLRYCQGCWRCEEYCCECTLWQRQGERGDAPQDQPGVDDLGYVMSMARQIKSYGLQFYLDFHYSDTWADPGHSPRWVN